MNHNKVKQTLSLITTFSTVILTLISITPILADDITSDNYKILAPTLSTGDDISDSTGYSLLETMGEFSADPRLFTASYEVRPGIIEIIAAHTPQITCFETTTDGSSNCDSSNTPQYVRDHGMARVCGPTGCYERAHFEIDPQSNPSDTLYGIQVSTTADFSTTYYVDSGTFTLVSGAARTIDDYQTETFWETELFNIRGLNAGTQYWLRATALHGNFTESQPGPAKTATTSTPYLAMDITLADTTSVPPSPVETVVSLNLPSGVLRKAEMLIWIDSDTNCWPGMELSLRGQYGALYQSASASIPSATIDLATASSGFGLQHYQMDQDYETASGQGELATMAVTNSYTQTYSSRTENVGAIPQNPTTAIIYESSGPLYNGESGTYVAAKSETTTSPGGYTEVVTFTMVTKY